METRSRKKRTGRGTRGEPLRQNRELKKKIIAGEIKVPDDDAKVAEWAKTAF